MGRPPKHYSDVELAALRDRRNELRREQYRLDGGKRKAENQAWKDAHREQVRAAGREYQQRRRALDPDATRKQLKWQKNNPEKMARYRKNWYANNDGRKYHREWALKNRVKNPELYVWRNARNRAKETGREFSIEKSDIVIPEICPVLGIPISKQVEGFQPNSPSLDRIDSSRGYVPGNIAIISWRANCLKRDGTLDEFRKIVAYMEHT